MAAPTPVHPNTYQAVTGDDGEGDRTRWDAVFSTPTYLYGREPAEFLKLHVEGVDYSDVALRKARRLAKENRVQVKTVNAGELRKAFADFEILLYEESNDGKNAVASLIARKPLRL